MRDSPRKILSLFDSTCLIVGIIIGAGIYQTAPEVARGAGCRWGVLALWLAGGLLSLCGALNYAELATALPQAGGDYLYLNRAYGRWAGFLFGWMQLTVVRPGDIAVMAFAFATYARVIYDPLPAGGILTGQQLLAAGAVAVLSAINILGVHAGKWTQNLLTMAKVLGLLAIIGVAWISPSKQIAENPVEPFPLNVALILVLFTYGGWNEMAYVAAEVRDPQRNIVRALVVGTTAVTVIYLLANAAFLFTLGYAGMANSTAVATDAVRTVFPKTGGPLIGGLICVSALGAVNGLIFTGARISYAVGSEHRLFRGLGAWSGRTGTPIWALTVQMGVALTLIFALGSFLNAILYTAAAVYSFYLATGLAVIVLRFKEPRLNRPFRVAGYPFTTLIFCAVCVFLIHGAATHKPIIAAAAGGMILLGYPVYRFSRRFGMASAVEPIDTPATEGFPE
jgi:basic amino acid/polyamine antiporter, APA family